MAETTAISWTDRTWSPWEGCTRVSEAKNGGGGCDNCYAERDAKRYQPGKVLWGVDSERRTFGDAHWNEPLRWARTLPAKLGRRPRVFCASMADVFDKDAPAGARDRLLALIAETPQLDWLLLTKRIGNAQRMLDDAMLSLSRGSFAWTDESALPNLWLGATVVNQEEADRDIPKLLAVPARVRFLSIEPMLAAIDLHDHLMRQVNGFTGRLHWIIAGGESGPKARPTPVSWLRSVVEQCKSAGVAVHVKQLGAQPREWCAARVHADPADDADCDDDHCDFYEASEQGAPCPGRCGALVHPKGGDPAEWPEDLRVQEFPHG